MTKNVSLDVYIDEQVTVTKHYKLIEVTEDNKPFVDLIDNLGDSKGEAFLSIMRKMADCVNHGGWDNLSGSIIVNENYCFSGSPYDRTYRLEMVD